MELALYEHELLLTIITKKYETGNVLKKAGNMTVDMDMFPFFISVTLAPLVLLQLCLVFS